MKSITYACISDTLPAQEPTVEPNSQRWAELSGAVAFHLIDRHAENWADAELMMNEWRAAHEASAQKDSLLVECLQLAQLSDRTLAKKILAVLSKENEA
jgi:hypothetical protein